MKKSVLYVGQAYYNHWYLSRELRKLGWRADQLDLSTQPHDSSWTHGQDFTFFEKGRDTSYLRFLFFLNALVDYDIFHFANAHNLGFYKDLDSTEAERKNVSGFKKFFFNVISSFLLKTICKWEAGRIYVLSKKIGRDAVYRGLRYFSDCLPYRWDILLLKKTGKKILYTNNGCLDAVTQTSFRAWSTPDNIPVCDICAHKNKPEICSDELNSEWGKFRNAMSDYQFILGGNKADFNKAPTVHEVPEIYCLDTDFWSPDLLVPANYLLPYPAETIKLFHAVGNFNSRVQAGNKTIKSTHIYIPVVEELKKEGKNVELMFFNDVPNKKLRYYQAQADIFIDMLTFGFFGANVREGMMLGKPCICYLRPEWMEQMRAEVPEYADELPVISATPDTIKAVLKDLIDNPEKRKEIGNRSREFAVKWHGSAAAAEKIDSIYQSLLHGKG
jgi:glycosyltransferase involved in cell wall biosynthesis